MASHARHLEPLQLRVSPEPRHDTQRTDVWLDDLRSVAAMVGVALMAAGVAIVLASALVDLILALPLRHIALRGSLWVGLATAGFGLTMARACRARRLSPAGG